MNAALRVLTSGQDGPCGITVDGARVYWANLNDGTVKCAPLAGGEPRVLASETVRDMMLRVLAGGEARHGGARGQGTAGA